MVTLEQGISSSIDAEIEGTIASKCRCKAGSLSLNSPNPKRFANPIRRGLPVL